MKKKPKVFKIYKSSGRTEPFSKFKLLKSIKRTGLPPRECKSIAEKVTDDIGEGFKTKDIYRKTLTLLGKTSSMAAAQYSLKRSIFELGPTGHHFELYVSKYFEALNYQTKISQTLKGKWVTHEVDVLAYKGKRRFFVECKFHNRIGIKNDIKVALYVKARWDDLREGPHGRNLSGFYLVSNTAFSKDAITYAEGTGLQLLGVNAPMDRSFLEQIKDLDLFPITSLKTLSKYVKNELLNRGIILTKDLPHHRNLLCRLGLSDDDLMRLDDELLIFNGAV
jgi:hypothetical protein